MKKATISKEIREYIKEQIGSQLLDYGNAQVSEIRCYHKSGIQYDVKIYPMTEILIHRDQVIKVFCIHNPSGQNCTYEKDKPQTCYLYNPKAK
ncbi:MAG: hypothetical protein LBD46_05190 [Endomicrobium sp.]|jgi:hypothetical protein|nr:hypothetical protein [Endomicrobium sp.]